MANEKNIKNIIKDLKEKNLEYISKKNDTFFKQVKGQSPKIAVLTCADSRVIPEYIFQKDIGELFVVRVAGNIAIDPCVISSLEYAVEHLDIDLLLILGHSDCGAIKAAECSEKECRVFLEEIKKGFLLDSNHVIGNLKRQTKMLPLRSKIISNAIKNKKIKIVSGVYDLKTGLVNFL